MAYENITVDDIALLTHDWVEAQNIVELRQYICDWFDLLETNQVSRILPNPHDTTSLEEAVALIKVLDDDFNKEHNRWYSLNVEAGPDFMRLPDNAKIAFVQGIKKIYKNRGQVANKESPLISGFYVDEEGEWPGEGDITQLLTIGQFNVIIGSTQ